MLAGIRWDFLWQRHQTLATHFARNGYRTIFVETTGLANPRLEASYVRNVLNRILRWKRTDTSDIESANPSIYSPLTLPPTGRIPDGINEKLLIPKAAQDLKSMLAGERPVVIVYPPTRTSLRLAEAFSPRLVYYDCSEEYERMSGVPKDIRVTERELLRRADVVSCTSTRLLERIVHFRPDAFLCGPGVEAGRFERHRGSGREPQVVCYFGHLGDDRIRLDVLREIVASGFGLRVVGEVRGRAARSLLELPGVDYRGAVPHESLPEALDGVDAFVMPYRTNALTAGISPAKTYEALATGKPVVAAPIPSLDELKNHVYLAREPHEYVSILNRLDETESPEKVAHRRELANANSWEVRFREIEVALLQRLEEV